jgi:hypothetical protein
MKKLTIGIATYDDYDGVFFTIQAIRMYHPEILNDIEFVVIDNNPDSVYGVATKNFTNSVTQPIQYIPFTEYKTPFVKGKIFEYARTPYVLGIDGHILLEPGCLKKLIDFYEWGADGGNFLQGPLVYDDLKNVSTHFDLVWRGHMWGIWATDDRGKDPNSPPFEIPAQGMGLFSCRRDSWLGFNPLFRGFGGEEGYIHEKYRKAGKKTLCLPFLRWNHRFGRPGGVKYPLTLENKIRNYFIGFTELGLDITPIYEHFTASLSRDKIDEIYNNVKTEMIVI